jgi:hypothetical protein
LDPDKQRRGREGVRPCGLSSRYGARNSRRANVTGSNYVIDGGLVKTM